MRCYGTGFCEGHSAQGATQRRDGLQLNIIEGVHNSTPSTVSHYNVLASRPPETVFRGCG